MGIGIRCFESERLVVDERTARRLAVCTNAAIPPALRPSGLLSAAFGERCLVGFALAGVEWVPGSRHGARLGGPQRLRRGVSERMSSLRVGRRERGR